jgi:tRNA 2-thiouridine synthesizing protein A
MTMTLQADELQRIEPDSVVDARGCACPGPLMEAKKAIGSVSVGGIVEVRSEDPGSRNDIPIWADKVGHECLGYLRSEEEYDRIFIRRGK